jgi:subtilisin-like proprotein convertase family protein
VPEESDASIPDPDAAPPDAELPPENCDNDLDDDGDHFVDCGDPDCVVAEHCQPEMACNDDEDNDRDGDEDCADSDCAAAPNCLPEGLCSNGTDDDLDGDADCADSDCEILCVAGCSDDETLIILPATGLPQVVDTADVVVDFPITMSGYVRGVAVRFTITHTFPGDLDISMRSPDGATTIDLSSDNGATGMNYTDTVISNEATTPITSGSAPFTGTYLPEEPMTRLMGLPSLGTWQLVVHDDFAGETGSVESADIYLCVCDGEAGCEQHRACLDGLDNDGDTLIDCLDTADCGAIPQCTPETMCSDDVDNNLDGQTDCQDPDCNGIDGCENPETTCTDNLDNDQNGDPDCADTDCAATAHCLPEADCGDGIDDDSDGLIDCFDVGCDGIDGCELGSELTCDDGFDNDGDGVSDCADADCSFLLVCNGVVCPPGLVATNRLASDVPQAIDSLTTVESIIDIGEAGLVNMVAVKIDVAHTNDSDLDIFLDAPDGTAVELSTDNGSTGDNYVGTVFIDSATTTIVGSSAPFTGLFRPEGTLGTLISRPVLGDWTLRVTDDLSGTNVGTLTSFQILVCHCDAASGDCEFGVACRNGTDDDGDGVTDCAESSCGTDPFCIPEAICDDGLDQDLDGLTDCLDPHCDGIAGCQLGTETACTDNFDNDGDGGADCADTDCGATAHCLPEANCMDGTDDDGDGLADCLDVGCDGMAGCELGGEDTCNDTLDNDGDLAADCADTECAGSLYCNTTCPAGMSTMYRDSTDVPVAIPSSTTVTSTIPVAEVGVAKKVVVGFDINHTWDSDLDIFLEAPSGTDIELTTDNGSSSDNYLGTIFDDTATTLVTSGAAPFTGRFRPEEPLAGLLNTPITGDWVLDITDDVGGDEGILHRYDLLICYCDPTSGNCEFDVECRNGTDDDNDTLIDCADSNCAADPFCLPESVCNDGVDQDFDTLTDCLDPDCNGVSGCEFGTELSCFDGINNDGDGATDCFDPDCSADPNCQVELVCNNGLDDDGNGMTDCLDPACATGLWCSPEVDCDDGLDNDGDGATDCVDVGCNGIDGCVLAEELACEDGLDNDADGLADCADPSCSLWCAIPSCPVGTEKVLYQGTGLPQAIADGQATNPVFSPVVTDVPGLVSQVAVRVDITHTDTGDIDMFLVTPFGPFELSTDTNSGGDNYVRTVFVDTASTAITAATAPFTGSFRPEFPLAGLAGVPTTGTWSLQVADDLSADTGSLVNYQLLFCQCDAASGDCEVGEFACRNGVDDDGDGLVDCAEASCASDAMCVPPPVSEEVCNDGVDDDGDGNTDCADSDCGWVCNALGSVCSTGGRQLLRYGAVGLPEAIPSNAMSHDNAPIVVDRSGTVVRAALRFNATHTAAGNLQLRLQSPAGTNLDMTINNGGTVDNYTDTVFVDTAPGVIGTTGFTTAPFTGPYRPEEALALVSFEDPLGLWIAQLRDTTTTEGGSWTEASLGLCIIP